MEIEPNSRCANVLMVLWLEIELGPQRSKIEGASD